MLSLYGHAILDNIYPERLESKDEITLQRDLRLGALWFSKETQVLSPSSVPRGF